MKLRPRHPGKIVFLDHDEGSERIESYFKVSPGIAFVELQDRIVPVTKIIKQTRGDRIIIRSYGPGDEFLLSTIGVSGA